MSRGGWWFFLAVVASGCGVRFAACEPSLPVENLPVKLWSCNARLKHCEVYARFKSSKDCHLYDRLLYAECDPAAPSGEIHCRNAAPETFRKQWFSECSEGDLTFAEVHDGGTWVQ